MVDPYGTEDGASDLLRRFEDRDEPVTADPDVELEIERDREELLRLAARAALRGDTFGITPRGDGHPPEPVASWLAEQGVEV